MSYSEYHARCWAENSSIEEIQQEINRLKIPRDFTNNLVGNAHFDYSRIEALKLCIKEKLND